MHYLSRSEIQAPTCLRRYQYGRDTWCNVLPNHKAEIRNALEAMQGRRCAYCECSLDDNKHHIEHFRQRSRCPQETFEWKNLFWSCQRTKSCGKHKDSCGMYNYEHLIKPDAEDPEEYFLFLSDGTITIRSNLTGDKRSRAEETLRIFNLDAQSGPLRYMRKEAVSPYVNTIITELISICTAEEIMNYIKSEYGYAEKLPFCTAIKHTLTSQGT